MKVLDKIKLILQTGICPPSDSVDDPCSGCPLMDIEPGLKETYCDAVGGASHEIAAKLWLFDHGHNKSIVGQKLSTEQSFPLMDGWVKNPYEKKDQLYGVPWDKSVPEGVTLLEVDCYRDNIKVRVFLKDFKATRLDELDGKFMLGNMGGPVWWILSKEKVGGLGFDEDEDLGWCRAIAQNGQMLSDVMVLGVDDEVLHPTAHKKRNFRKIKT